MSKCIFTEKQSSNRLFLIWFGSTLHKLYNLKNAVKQTNKQTINPHSVEVRAETSSKIATPIGDTLSSVTNCRSTDQ